MADEDVQYQYRSVKAIRGTEAKTIAKWKTQGWDLESQTPGTLRTEISFRRVKPKDPFQGLAKFAAKSWVALRGLRPTTQRRILGGLGGFVALLVIIGVVAGISGGGDDTKPRASPTKPTSAQTKATSSAVPSDTPSVTPTPTPTPTPSESTEPATHEVLTVKNSKDLRKLLAVGDNCSETVARFVSKYQGRTITFDGSVSAVSNHGNYNTRFDFLLAPGNKGSESASGPTFQFQNVNYYDLNLTGKTSRTLWTWTTSCASPPKLAISTPTRASSSLTLCLRKRDNPVSDFG